MMYKKTYTDSALSDRFKDHFNQFKDKYEIYKYLEMIDSLIIQSKILELDHNDLPDDIKEILKNEPKKRIHNAIYRAIRECFQTRFPFWVESVIQNDSIKFTIINCELFDSEIFSNPEESKQVLENDIDKEKTVDSDKEEFRKDTNGGFSAYERKNTMQYFSKDFVSDIMLPGHVYNGKESCGEWKTTGCLQGDLHEHKGGYICKGVMHCNNKGCRKCATSSIKREAHAITDRLMTFCNLKGNRKVYLKGNRSRILSHVVVSIPFEECSLYLTKDGRKKLRVNAINNLKQLDIDGGVMIDHPYRFTKGLESARFSPHFHFILTGWLDGQKVKDVYEKTGWIITNVSTIESWKDCHNLSKYLLSHSAVFMKEEGKRSSEHSVRYFGECHNRKFKVETVLKHSITGYHQLDSILYTRKELERKGVVYQLQDVIYTHSIIKDRIKDAQNTYFTEYVNGNPLSLSKSLRRFIDIPKDNPAIPQSDPPSMEFLQMRFDYGNSQYDIVQSVYVNVILDPDLEYLCPECTMKMETLTPCDRGWSDEFAESMASVLVDLHEGDVIPIDDVTQFDYLRNTRITHLGMPYFDLDGKLQYDPGIYQKPECLDTLNSTLYWSVLRNINTQKAKSAFKLQNCRSPTPEELQKAIKIQKPKRIDTQSLLDFID